MNARIVKEAFIKSFPIFFGYIVIGFGFGIMLRNAGYGLVWALAMSLFIYAGSMQYVGISLITGPATILMTILTTIMVNARHLFYSLSMITKYQNAGKYKPYLIFSLTDETYALLSAENYPDEENSYSFYFLVSLFNHSYWVLGTILGSIFAEVLPFKTAGIEFSMTALFIAAFTEQWLEGQHRISAAVGFLITLIARFLFGRDVFLIPAMLGMTIILILIKPILSKDQEFENES